MILYKWTHNIDADPNVAGAPSIINSLICMAMGQEDTQPIYKGSVELSKTLMVATIVSVPFMLFPKPFILLSQHNAKKKKESLYLHAEADEEAHAAHGADHDGHGEFEFGEVFI